MVRSAVRRTLGIAGPAALVSLWLIGLAAGPAQAVIACGKTIKHDTTLGADLTGCSGDGLTIGKDGVTLNLNGHTVSGTGAVGIRLDGHQHVTVDGQGAAAMPGT